LSAAECQSFLRSSLLHCRGPDQEMASAGIAAPYPPPNTTGKDLPYQSCDPGAIPEVIAVGHVSRTILAKHIPIDLKVGDLETTQLTNVGERWNAGFRKGRSDGTDWRANHRRPTKRLTTLHTLPRQDHNQRSGPDVVHDCEHKRQQACCEA